MLHFQKCFLLALVLTLGGRLPVFGQQDLKQKLESITTTKKAEVRLAVLLPQTGEKIAINGDVPSPMMSVFKFHIALAVLHQVDSGNLKLDQLVKVREKDLIPNTWSPLAKAFPAGGEIPLRLILKYTVSQSDNNGCDILLRLLGGPAEVEAYMREIGVADIAIAATEADMHRDQKAIFMNWTTPSAVNELLAKFEQGKLLSDNSYQLLWQMMSECTTGLQRIRGQLPAGTIVADRTGTSGTSDQGLTDAVNDIGIIRLPDGREVFLTVFVCNTMESYETNEQVIADIAKVVWDFYTNPAADTGVPKVSSSASVRLLTNYEVGQNDRFFNVIVQSGDSTILEYYNNVKRWMMGYSKMVLQEDGTYLTDQGNKVDPAGYYELEVCDEVVNAIRNEACKNDAVDEVRDRQWKVLSHPSRLDWSNSEELRADLMKTTCHDKYLILLESWKQQQFHVIDSIKAVRTQRLVLIRSNPEKVDRDFIKVFLKEYANCMEDQAAMYEIMKIRRDEVMLLWEENNWYFEHVEYQLCSMPAAYASEMLALVESYEKRFPLKPRIKRTLRQASRRS